MLKYMLLCTLLLVSTHVKWTVWCELQTGAELGHLYKVYQDPYPCLL